MKKFREISEQYREEGRHKLIYPKNKAVVSPRPESDSAKVKLREGRVEDEGLPSVAAATLKDKPNKESMPKLKEETHTPPISVRSLYTKMYAKHGGTASKVKDAQSKAYAEVEKKHGKEMRNSLEAFHKKNMNEETDTTEKVEMTQSQLHFIHYACEEILEYIDDGGEVEEWYQVKVAKAFSEFESMHSFIEGEKRRTGMVKEEQAESVPASKALQKAHDDERKKRGLPDPSYYLELMKKKKKEIEDMKKEEVDESIASSIGGALGRYAGEKVGLGPAAQAHGEVAGRMIDYHARKLFKKAKKIITGEEVELDEAIPKSTGYALVHSSSRKIVAKGNKAEMMKKMKELNAKEKNSHHLGVTNRGKVGDTFGEEVELDEENKPTNPELWSRAVAMAKSKFDVYPSAYANGWAAKWYKSKGGGWKSVKEETELEEGYYKSQETERQETERLSKPNDLPFTPDKPKKKSVVVGKKPEGYSIARQLARQAMKKYLPVKEAEERGTEPFLKSSRKAEIVKGAAKKGQKSDKFVSEPVLSSTVTRNN